MTLHCCSGQARAALRDTARQADLVIMSYETLRGDADWATSQPWLYAVLDEGHTIRNSKSKIAQARGQPARVLTLRLLRPAIAWPFADMAFIRILWCSRIGLELSELRRHAGLCRHPIESS